MLPSVDRHAFVYGTLRQGEQRDINRLIPAPRRIGHARVRGVLYDLGPYPGAVLGEPGWIQGEVYAISLVLERLLDEIEEVWPQQSGEYAKRELLVRPDLPAGKIDGPESRLAKEIACIVYEIAPDRIIGKPVIRCGDWVQHRLQAISDY